MKDLHKKLMAYIRLYNKVAKPIKWSYSDSSKRITTDSYGTVH